MPRPTSRGAMLDDRARAREHLRGHRRRRRADRRRARGGGGEAHLAPLTYGGLAAFGARAGAALYACAAYDASRGEPPRLATLLRNSAAAAVAFVCLAERWTLAPLNAAIGRELAFELDDLPAHAVVLDDAVAPAWAADECGKRAVPTFAFAPDRKTVGAFALAPRAPAPPFAGAPASLDTVALLLHTSGTTSKPKLVPLTHGRVLAGATSIGATLDLRPDDACVNVMPLFHIHGLSVNILATLLRGASVACELALDPARFLDLARGRTAAPPASWYSAPSDPNVAAFVRGGAGERCWLRTGDRGLLEPGGGRGARLRLVGRSKEIVNRGGEKISPLAVEDVLLRHAAVREVACFAAPHAQLGEVAGALVVLEAGRQSTHEALRHWCVAGVGDALALDDKWAPALTVFSARVPKGPTGKPLRIKLAQRLGVEALDQLRAATPVSFDVGPDAFLDAATPVSLRSSAPAFFAAAASSSKRDADSSPEAVDDSMALFAKGGGPAGPPKPSAAAMQGHVYFVAMLGILLTHGSLPLDHIASPANPRNWAGMRQLRANIGAGYGIALFFAVAGAGDARNFERHGRRERQTAREVLKPLAVVYGAMILLDASSHVVYESLRRNFGWGWAEAQKAPWPLRPNLNRTKWFVAMLALARLLGQRVRALPRESPLRRCVPVVALVVHVGQVALAPLGGVEVPGSGLGLLYYERVTAAGWYFFGPCLLPAGALTPACSAFGDDAAAGVTFEVDPFLLRCARGLRAAARRLRRPSSKVRDEPRDEPDEDDAGVALSPAAARHAAAAVIAARLWRPRAASATATTATTRRAVGSPGAASLVVCGLRAYCDGGFVGDLNSTALAFAVLLAQALFSGAYIAATAYAFLSQPFPPLSVLRDKVRRYRAPARAGGLGLGDLLHPLPVWIVACAVAAGAYLGKL
ncbi:ligase [Aureococcus anophagefferens]|nr:ligase [Aureococcus anophagefferens]